MSSTLHNELWKKNGRDSESVRATRKEQTDIEDDDPEDLAKLDRFFNNFCVILIHK